MKPTCSAFLTIVFMVLMTACSSTENTYQRTKNYKPDDPRLYKEIVLQDSLFFAAYNNCGVNLEKYGAFYTDDIEFYHDNGGLMTSKSEIIESTKKYVCGKVTRELVKGSIEVYPIKNYGAIEIGLHHFRNSAEPNSKPKTSRFTIFWKKVNGDWKIAKVISLH